MQGNFHGVFIGINKYQDSRNFSTLEFAEKDASDVKNVFTDPQIGFPSGGSVEVLLGEKATKQNIEGTLHTILVKHCKPADTIIVYYSGHGFLTGEGNAFLGTYDTQMADIVFNPNSGLRMDYIYNALFLKSPAVRILFILDCCYSEAFIPPSKSTEKAAVSKNLIDETLFPQAEGRIAIFSSPRNVKSRENLEKKNGVFTYHLVEGLRGDSGAVEETGEVTVESLMSYVKLRVPDTQPAGFAGKMVDRFVLTRNHMKKNQSHQPFNELWNKAAYDALLQGEASGIQMLQNPIVSCLPFIENLSSRVSHLDTADGYDVGRLILEAVRSVYDAQFVGIIRVADNKAEIGYSSISESKDVGVSSLTELVGSQVLRAIDDKAFPLGCLGVSRDVQVPFADQKSGVATKAMIIPLDKGLFMDFLVVNGISNRGLLYMGEAYAVILKSLYMNSNELNDRPTYSALKSAILDDLKTTYGFVPIEMYEQRFSLFQDSLLRTHMVFEPILNLDPEFLYIDGWEALAREGNEEHAPAHLFRAAELWGARFMIELDDHFITDATNSFRKILDARRVMPNQIPKLSMNVYPASLVRRAYRETVDRIIHKEKVLPGNKLIFEISEKLAIVADEPLTEPEILQEFRHRLNQYTSSFGVNFAIDDFGVGYSSVSRLANISPFYVKIDRDVLLRRDFCELTLKYVKQMVELNKTSPPVIVIEGFDGTTAMAVTLRQIYDSGIKYIQGYILGKAGPDLYDLDDNLMSHLKAKLVG